MVETWRRIMPGESPLTARLLFASNNPHKLTEVRRLLEPLGIQVMSPQDVDLEIEVEETGTSFEENAILKAMAFSTASGSAALADDSGLIVDALGGEPGILSARYGGPGLTDRDRTNLVVTRMADVPLGRRTARFSAAVALAVPGRDPIVFRGEVEGLIAAAPVGSNGFGYDPIFYYPPFEMTFGEVIGQRKDSVSHRARALAELARYLRSTGMISILEHKTLCRDEHA